MAGRGTTDRGLVLHGVNAVRAALAQGHLVHRVHLCPRSGGEAVRALATERGVPVVASSPHDLARLCATDHHQGVAATCAPYAYAALESVLVGPGRGVVLVDGVQDPRNLGALLRCARAAGVRGVIVPRDRCAPMSAVALAASAGTAFGLRVARVTNLVRTMVELKRRDYWLVGLAAGAPRALTGLPAMEEPALVVGGEGAGLRPLVRRHCDFEASIPMAEGVESLNLAVATAIGLYELLMRRVGDAV